MTSNFRKIANEELNRISVEQFKNSSKTAACLILDDIRSMHNVGSAFRTADAFRVEKIFLAGITATPPHREIQKAALGATESVEWEYASELLPLLKKLQQENWTIVAVEQAENSLNLQDFTPALEQKYAFIFGNEVMGIKQEALAESSLCLEIPQFGTKHSLNISVSIGIVLWDFFSKRYKNTF